MAKTFKKLNVVKLSSNFREATEVVEQPLRQPASDEVLVKVLYSGVNATDINISAGRYFTDGKVPFDIGLEALGVVHQVGSKSNLKPGQAVVLFTNRGYSEYIYVKEDELNKLVPIPEAKPELISFLVCGMTVTIGLDLKGHIEKGDKVLITAAAGGTGHIGVQWAKQRGCHVIGTCSSQDKVDLLKSLGCDRVINYKQESLDDVLTKEYPDGVDVVWETIGGETTKMLEKHLAKRGRLIVVGGIVGYQGEGFPTVQFNNINLLMNSHSISGFLLFDYLHVIPEYFKKLLKLFQEGNLKILLDRGQKASTGPFEGIHSAVNAVEYLHSGKNVGKVVVKLQ